ncbi:NAD-dependent epimerase [Metapseudomonas furukawaii]|jgi:UDP-glucuronate 4-epimerase|uniref:dTDP-glucose 4,6-dehydratase n=1 Tax=Metapseudomonas furukawaii TaxID=1149133 RepID=A0AAD1BZW7_METFU|nr:NAD-dependent epimerase [Pseudomonas furukawaii]ELS26489.1 dTDP-glucose 4,6-dehydratase [Pseudomonas furukawaii]BAU74255.1 dTDP-glucose 4,6-dehydratase [Pseudomonas furukawaii]
MKFLVTGAAGFIGFHTAMRLCRLGHEVLGIDNLNDYYSVDLKLARLARLQDAPGFSFRKLDIADRDAMRALFDEQRFERVIHLAAQAGVRYSLDNPHVYADSNLSGFVNVLEGCRQTNVGHLAYASSSSVYGTNAKVPFAVEDAVDNPISLYAATKRANELMAHTYAHLYRLPTTGLRFFTVYGPWGRPDMAPFKFTKAILEGQPIDIYNGGEMSRDFTYIDDVVEGIVRIQDCPPPYANEPEELRRGATDRLFNIGLGSPVRLLDFVACIESATGVEAIKQMKPMQPGDVLQTWADVGALASRTGFRPATPLHEGVARFVDWYRTFYGV